MKNIACAIGLGLALPAAALAQTGVGTLSHTEAGLTRLHDGMPSAATLGTALLGGDQLQTTDGRAEIALPDGALLHLDHHTRVVVRSGDRAEVLAGRVSVRTGSSKPYLVDVATTKLTIQLASVVEIASNADLRDMDMRVINGSVQVDTPKGSARVPDYKRCYVAGPSSAPAVNSVIPTLAGDFERWALSRQVLAESTPLKGTEGGGGVAYAPWVNAYFAYAAPIYYQPVTYYSYPYYPYYTYPSYYPSYPYYPYTYSYSGASSTYYSPSRSYYYGHYGSYYGGYYGGSSRERYTWSAPPQPLASPRTPPTPTPTPWPSAPPAAGAGKPAPPKP